MSRKHQSVSPEIVNDVFGTNFTEPVDVTYGFDGPCHDYFIETFTEIEDGEGLVGVHYGGIGFTEEVTRGKLLEIAEKLHLPGMADAIALDMPL